MEQVSGQSKRWRLHLLVSKTVKKIEHGITMYSTTYSYFFVCFCTVQLHTHALFVEQHCEERNKYAIQSKRPEVETF